MLYKSINKRGTRTLGIIIFFNGADCYFAFGFIFKLRFSFSYYERYVQFQLQSIHNISFFGGLYRNSAFDVRVRIIIY